MWCKIFIGIFVIFCWFSRKRHDLWFGHRLASCSNEWRQLPIRALHPYFQYMFSCAHVQLYSPWRICLEPPKCVKTVLKTTRGLVLCSIKVRINPIDLFNTHHTCSYITIFQKWLQLMREASLLGLWKESVNVWSAHLWPTVNANGSPGRHWLELD